MKKNKTKGRRIFPSALMKREERFFLLLPLLFLLSAPRAWSFFGDKTSGLIRKSYQIQDKESSSFQESASHNFQVQKEYAIKNKNISALQEGKKAIINGDLELAKFFLSKVNGHQSKLGPLRKRYLSLLYFILEDYKKSLSLISGNEFSIGRRYSQICLLKTMNLMALAKEKEFKTEMSKCQNATLQNAPHDHFWTKQVIELRERNPYFLKGDGLLQLRRGLKGNEFIKLWIKLALFMNKERMIIQYIPELPPLAYHSKEIRELIGFAYYRMGNLEKAQEFIEDIETPNADNIRGNINLIQKKWELAFGHFKLALNKKKNSRNALERAIPLSYLLGQWDEGLKMLQQIVGKYDEKKKMALQAIFSIRKDHIKKARQILNILEYRFLNSPPSEVILMDSYVSLKEADQERLKKYSLKACQKNDGLNCWITLQLLTWENLGKTLTRKEKTFTKKDFSIEELKKEAQIQPLEEAIFINQRDIEELDEKDLPLLN